MTEISCVCYIEVSDSNEYQALEEVINMIEKPYKLSKKVTLTVKETITTFSHGCGVNYE